MNLGWIALLSFLALSLFAILLSLAAAIVLCRLTRWGIAAALLFVILLPLTVVGTNQLFHQRLFVWWHQAQNNAVPREFPCLEYTPQFSSLRARYQMTEPELDAWVGRYPGLKLAKLEPMRNEEKSLGPNFKGKVFASERWPSGRQLRVFWADDITYIAYSAR